MKRLFLIAAILLCLVTAAIAGPAVTPQMPTSITGNAATATALAANPTDCGANAVATAIDASGNLTCGKSIGTDIQAYEVYLAATYMRWTKPANIADSATPAIGAALGNVVDLDGTTTITAFDTIAAGVTKFVTFTGARTITYNGTSMILPGSRDIVTEAGDRAIFISLGSGNWRCHEYLKFNGLALGDIIVVNDAAAGNITASKMRGQTHTLAVAGTYTLAAMSVGQSLSAISTGANIVSVQPTGQQFRLGNTLLTSGNKITSSGNAGDEVYLRCIYANIIEVVQVKGLWVDGGQ